MRRILMFCLVFALTACALNDETPRAQTADGQPPAVTDRRELIVLTAGSAASLTTVVESLNYTVRAVHPLPELNDTLIVLRIPETRTIPTAIEEIEAAAPSVTAGANHLYRLQAIAGADRRDYAAAMIGWPKGGCRARVRVGMIDAGVTPGHRGLKDGRIAQRSFVEGSANTRHGDRVAELLVGRGRLRGTELLSARVIDPALEGGNAAGVVAILRAVNWLAAEEAKIVNVSLAGPYNKLMDRALSQAAADGMALVAAVGNAGPRHPPQYPAAFPFALAVTAVDREGAIYRNAVRGPHVDLAAPGVDILLTLDGRPSVSSGTSLAAPFVTNVIAADPALARLPVATLRRKLARRAKDLGADGRDTTFGAGLVSATPNC